MKTWRESIGLAMIAAPGYGAALAIATEHHRVLWVQVVIGCLTFGGFSLLTWGER